MKDNIDKIIDYFGGSPDDLTTKIARALTTAARQFTGDDAIEFARACAIFAGSSVAVVHPEDRLMWLRQLSEALLNAGGFEVLGFNEMPNVPREPSTN
jgi:hypothetical protein